MGSDNVTCHAGCVTGAWQYMILGLQKIMKKTKYYWLNMYNIAETIGKLLGKW